MVTLRHYLFRVAASARAEAEVPAASRGAFSTRRQPTNENSTLLGDVQKLRLNGGLLVREDTSSASGRPGFGSPAVQAASQKSCLSPSNSRSQNTSRFV